MVESKLMLSFTLTNKMSLFCSIINFVVFLIITY